jgi:hypothetical protein
MEQNSLNNLPKFESAEEELAFLREHVARREREISGAGQEVTPEQIAKQTIEQYKQIPSEEILPAQKIVSHEEAQGIVLKLKPETHDAKMAEMMHILQERGIKNALSVVEHLNNPHLDDDFHRFLVQYLVSMKKIDGLKSGSALEKSLKMKLFEVTLPEKAKDEAKGFKEIIAVMEQFYSGMQSVSDGRDNFGKNYFTLEIALSNDNSEVVFYAGVPISKSDLFEKQLLASFPTAKVVEANNDYNIFTENGASAGAYAELKTHKVFPIKTYDKLENDPMNTILNVFSKLKGSGEGAAIQLVICPAGNSFIQKFNQVLEKVKEGETVKRALSLFGSLDKAFLEAGKNLLFGFDGKKEDKKVDDVSVQNITEKIKSTIIAANIRVIASAGEKDRAEEILSDIESAFNQFDEPNSNSFEFKKLKGSDLQKLFHEFSFRMYDEDKDMPLNFKELSTVFHFPMGVSNAPQLKQSQSATAPAPMEMREDGIFLGYNEYRGEQKKVFMSREDRMRHFYTIGQTGTGKTTLLKHMIIQDIKNGDGVCFIDPHGSDIQDILAHIPAERIDDVIYFDPAYTPRPMGLNMLEYDVRYPEQKTFVVNELLAIFNKLFDMKTAGGPAFEQYFRNSALLVMEDPDSGMTLLEIGRVLADKSFRDLKLSRCKNPIIKQFWENAEKTSGEQSLANFVPYVTNKFDVFVSNDIMRPIIAQEKSVFNFREVMDNKKILLVNLSKGRLGDINANLIGLILVGKMTMAALSRVDILGKGVVNDFYLYIDEFQNVTTDSIATILSEARKYRLSLNMAHQYVEQLEENIKNAVFGNVGSIAIHRVSPENAEVFAKQLEPTFTPADILKLPNLNCYVKMLVNGMPAKPFNSHTPFPPAGNKEIVEDVKELSYLKFGRPREEVEEEIIARYKLMNK